MSSSLLNWPTGMERTPPEERENTRKFSASFRDSKSDLNDEMGRMDVDEWRLDDVTGSGGDPGVVLRWKDAGHEYAVACDAYETKSSNLRSVYLYIKETRKRNDRPVQTGNDEFAAARLPSGDGASGGGVTEKTDRALLGVGPDASESEIKDAYRDKVKTVNPDKPDGDAELFKQVQAAYERLTED